MNRFDVRNPGAVARRFPNIPACAFAVAAFVATSSVASSAFAQPPAAGGKPAGTATSPASPSSPAASSPGSASSAPSTSEASSDPVYTLTIPGRTLLLQRLHPASFPAEAEVRCGTIEPCAFGLTRGFVLGTDLFGMATTTLLGQQLYAPGAWYLIDAFAGYQFLAGTDGKFFANGSVGYRSIGYRNDVGPENEERRIRSSGFTFRVNYAQEITPVYAQGVSFSIFNGKIKMTESAELTRSTGSGTENGAGSRKMMREFYDFSQQYPKIRLGLPADIEIINWKASHVDLPNHLRGYVRVEPFYIQNEFTIDDRIEYVEKFFGIRPQFLMAYESPQAKAGRYAFLAGVGFDLGLSNKPEAKYEGLDQEDSDRLRNSGGEPRPRRNFGSGWGSVPLLNLEASYQF